MSARAVSEDDETTHDKDAAAINTDTNDGLNVDNRDQGAEDGYFVVEQILDEQRSVEDGSLWYKVRWAGYGSEDDTLEPATELEHCVDIIADWKRRKAENKKPRGTP